LWGGLGWGCYIQKQDNAIYDTLTEKVEFIFESEVLIYKFQIGFILNMIFAIVKN
jgi:hypothetical protein